MWPFILFVGASVPFVVAIGVEKRLETNFVRFLKQRNETIVDVCVHLLSTKGKDWVFAKGLLLKEPFMKGLRIHYVEGTEAKDSQKIEFFMKQEKIFDFRFAPHYEAVLARDMYSNKIMLLPEEKVKMEAVMAHLHALYQGFLLREEKKNSKTKEKNENKQVKARDQLKYDVLNRLTDKPVWNKSLGYLSWEYESHYATITCTLSHLNEPHYVYVYDKQNEKGLSKVLKTENEEVFLALQLELDYWCLKQVEKREK